MNEQPQDEDLNLGRMRDRIITQCWNDQKKFPSVQHIALTTGLNVRTIFIIAKKLGLSRAKR